MDVIYARPQVASSCCSLKRNSARPKLPSSVNWMEHKSLCDFGSLSSYIPENVFAWPVEKAVPTKLVYREDSGAN
jgi:hypothetical protein